VVSVWALKTYFFGIMECAVEYVSCNVCGTDNTKVRFYVRDRNVRGSRSFKIVKCKNCGLVYLNPRPDKEEIRNCYPPWYHSRAQAKTVNIEKTWIWGIPWRKAMEKKAGPILRYKKEGNILDIGCGDGSLLKYMKGLGWQACGVEFNESSSRYAREVLGLNVFSGRLEEIDYKANGFDVIILFHVLEHLPDPSETLKRVRPLLKKNGFLLIEVPNFGSFEARLFKSKWNGISAPLHLYHFTPKTLENMLKNCSFAPLELEFIPEQTKYVAGYSESLRYCLMDLGLYPSRDQVEGFKTKKDLGDSSGSRWNNPLHVMEFIVFYAISYFMDKIGVGSNLLAVARKEV
jgi:2-polyprenyl-3-methyl-5-hydroxy-6-metoxy-1,4-benzoquinol methylase